MLGYMMEYLLGCYRGNRMFSFNEKVLKFHFKNIALITSSRLVSVDFVPTAIEDATQLEISFRDQISKLPSY